MGKLLFVLAERLRINRMNLVNILILIDTRQYWTVVLATVPVLDPAGFIDLRGNGLTPSKIDDFLSAPSHYGYKY